MGNCNSCFVIMSLLSSAATCAGFFLPYWIKGQLKQQPTVVATFFGTFRRCAFPQISADQTEIVIVNECGRYSSFMDIPSVYWQLTTLVVGAGSSLTLFSAVISFLACWVNEMWNKLFIKVLGILHLAAGLLITSGLCIYPLGWDHREVRDACGQSDKYQLGSCRIFWCYFILIATGSAEFFLFIASLRMSPSIAAQRPVPVAAKDPYTDYACVQDV
ncbi:LHFPL tetraspan subfamily member 6 protein-like [Paramacrobiotus metropolitanus]|uniref:LHFPL tetraspan subfamily member 6 protein-like n=1 Tax=Paramacrobiotus metropolitanus TaxID=2943436 RepID=UPI0024460773|nr:LHFPL tetraspan subfamily member 6 protein-like [Paramacrobiotus metropolitanus]